MEKKTDQTGKDAQFSKQLNPYIEKIWQSSQSTKQTSLLEESLVELDNDPSREQQPGCDNALWSRLCAARRRKINKELEIKFATQKLDDITNFIRVSLSFCVIQCSMVFYVLMNMNITSI